MSRFFKTALVNASGASQPFYQIANDGNLLPRAIKLTETDQQGIEKYSTEVVLQGFNSALTMLDRAGGGGGSSEFGGDTSDFGSSRPAARQPAIEYADYDRWQTAVRCGLRGGAWGAAPADGLRCVHLPEGE